MITKNGRDYPSVLITELFCLYFVRAVDYIGIISCEILPGIGSVTTLSICIIGLNDIYDSNSESEDDGEIAGCRDRCWYDS